ncbi:MAG: hemerythrin domain-containing protein [Planctomycetota bacterium]|nr:hemerythrin domain-containing protein [Planctomycetota bacterium]
MQPVELLMAEHRLILKMIGQMRGQSERMELLQSVNAAFVDAALDFLRNYADRCHHAKEESILFHLAAKKPLPGPMRRVMDELTEEHARLRAHVGELAAGRQDNRQGDPDAWRKVVAGLRGLIALCPAHFRKEEEQFFPAAMETLSPPEQQDLIERFHEADRRLIHEHYALLVCEWRPAGAPTK